jgi:acyl carrier protein
MTNTALEVEEAATRDVDARIVSVILRVLEQPGLSNGFGMDDHLSDLGLDSLKVIKLLIEVEGEFDITFPDELLVADTFRTAASLKAAVLSSLPARA